MSSATTPGGGVVAVAARRVGEARSRARRRPGTRPRLCAAVVGPGELHPGAAQLGPVLGGAAGTGVRRALAVAQAPRGSGPGSRRVALRSASKPCRGQARGSARAPARPRRSVSGRVARGRDSGRSADRPALRARPVPAAAGSSRAAWLVRCVDDHQVRHQAGGLVADGDQAFVAGIAPGEAGAAWMRLSRKPLLAAFAGRTVDVGVGEAVDAAAPGCSTSGRQPGARVWSRSSDTQTSISSGSSARAALRAASNRQGSMWMRLPARRGPRGRGAVASVEPVSAITPGRRRGTLP